MKFLYNMLYNMKLRKASIKKPICCGQSAKFRALPLTAKTGFSGVYFVFITFLYAYQ